MAYNFEGKQKGYLTLANRYVREIIDAVVSIEPKSALETGPCTSMGGVPKEGYWCLPKFMSNAGSWVSPSEIRAILDILVNRRTEVESHLISVGKREYIKEVDEFITFCKETLPVEEHENEREWGFFVK